MTDEKERNDCENAMKIAWKMWHQGVSHELIPEINTSFRNGFYFGWCVSKEYQNKNEAE